MTWCRFDRRHPQVPIQIPNDSKDINGADDPTRTDDLLITRGRQGDDGPRQRVTGI